MTNNIAMALPAAEYCSEMNMPPIRKNVSTVRTNASRHARGDGAS